ncbi:hypothetical protein O181_068204 [Austropuccinia psidii MF-1]|uniref:CCHC-type domain-containing protein n=1 Tax=Austropuccinia psidii MF-1 TaxID=1389203 RepID=A0A9Q3I7B6_9BASI|nr:hypothetical protein [Austropuccinia psidii MF-1]
MVQALDGGYIIPRLNILKLYIEQDLEAKVLIQQKECFKPKPPEKKTIFEEESWDEALKQVKELTQKIRNPQQPEPQLRNEGKESAKEVLNQLKKLSEAANTPRRNWNNNHKRRFPQNNQTYRPRNPLPPFSSSYQPYIPAQMAPRPPLKCAYCKEEGHSATRCTHLAEDLDKKNFQNSRRILLISQLSERTSRAQKEIYGETCGKKKQEEEVKPTEKKSEDKSTSISHVEDLSNWKPPIISSSNDPFESHIVLRHTKKRLERQAPNQEPKKKAAIPGTYIEEEKEEERVIIPTKFQSSNIPKPDQPEEEVENISNKNEDEEISKQEKKVRKPQKKQVEGKLEIHKIIKKIMQQKINLTIEEILRMSQILSINYRNSQEKTRRKLNHSIQWIFKKDY